MNALTIAFPADHPFHGAIVRRFGDKTDCPLLFEYGGRMIATNLFRMHDEMGIPLAVSIVQCMDRGWMPALEQFIADALRAGWPRERAQRMVEDACADAGYTAVGA